MLYRYADSPAANGSLESLSDAASVYSYAVNAMQWAVADGIVNGSNGKLNPQDNATRAQVAAILMRFCETGQVNLIQTKSTASGVLFLFLPHFDLYTTAVELEDIRRSLLFVRKEERGNVQQSKIPDARRNGRDSIMADKPDVAHGAYDGGRGKRLPASIHAEPKRATGQHIVHEQEQPPYRYELDVPCDDAVNAKVFVIDDLTHSTMLLAEEY